MLIPWPHISLPVDITTGNEELENCKTFIRPNIPLKGIVMLPRGSNKNINDNTTVSYNIDEVLRQKISGHWQRSQYRTSLLCVETFLEIRPSSGRWGHTISPPTMLAAKLRARCWQHIQLTGNKWSESNTCDAEFWWLRFVLDKLLNKEIIPHEKYWGRSLSKQ